MAVTSNVSSRLDVMSLSDEKVPQATDKGPSQTLETKHREDRENVARDNKTGETDTKDSHEGNAADHTNVVHVEIVGTGEETVEKKEKQNTDGTIDQLCGQLSEGNILPTANLQDGESSDDDSGVDDDDDGWITPSNINSVKQSMGEYEADELQRVDVGCLTTDFAMQVCHMS